MLQQQQDGVHNENQHAEVTIWQNGNEANILFNQTQTVEVNHIST